jgi:hypothetical protein
VRTFPGSMAEQRFPFMRADESVIESYSYSLERRPDGAVLVRVRSRTSGGHTLPEAVFAFRSGDPQFPYWDQQLRSREHASA